MKYTLHKLPEGFIITSDEPLKVLDYFYFNIDGLQDILQVESEFHLDRIKNYKENSKVIAQQDQIDFSALSEEEQKEIGWFNVEKLYNQYFPKLEQSEERKSGEKVGFEIGCDIMQGLISDRMFTLEELEWAFMRGALINQRSHRNEELSFTTERNKDIQSLSQKSWDVELEMEYPELCCVSKEGKRLSNKGCMERNHCEQPKCTNGKVKIIKLL